MSQQHLDFGTGADNDGEYLKTAMPKVQANLTELYLAARPDGRGRSIATVVPVGYGSSSLNAVGSGAAATLVGTAAGGGNPASTNEMTRRKRVHCISGTGVDAQCGFRSGANSTSLGYIGNATGRGGLTLRYRFGLAVLPSSWRAFIGLLDNGGNPTASAEPSTYTNCLGLAKDSADSQWYLIHNDASGSAVKIAISSTDVPITSATLIDVTITVSKGASPTVSYEVKTITGVDANGDDTFGTPVTGSFTTEIPAVDTALYPLLLMCNAASGQDARIAFLQLWGVGSD